MDISTIANSLESFELISKLISKSDISEIIEAIAQNKNVDAKNIAALPMGGYSKGKTSGSYYFILKDLKENLIHYKWLYSMLSDEHSKEVFLNLMRFRVFPSMDYVKDACDKDHDQYFDPKIIHCDEEEVFVDCGGFIGDTVESFIKNFKCYKHIYTYEPSRENIEKCEQTVSKYKDVYVKPFGVGKDEDVITFAQSGSSSSFMAVKNDAENDEVKITSLDIDIKESVSFIKMDIEGFEIDALIGAKHHIVRDNPKLAICVYHIVSDIWEIPKLIYSINPNYSFYLRHYREDQNWETVIYAIPKEKQDISLADKEQLGVYSVPCSSGCSINRKLIEKCGTVPFLFHKKYGYKVVMVGAKAGEYPDLDKNLKGVNIDFIADESIDSWYQYIIDHSRNMDILILNGLNPQYFPLLNLYRELRPDGKVYLALGGDSSWLDKIHLNNADLIKFMDQCNVISTSSKEMQKQLSIKLPYKIEYIPNVCSKQQKVEKSANNEMENARLACDYDKTIEKLHYLLFAER